MRNRPTSSPGAPGGIQLQLLARFLRPNRIGVAMEPKGIVYTKRWVVDLLLNLSGYSSEKDLANTLAIEPAAGDGAFLGPYGGAFGGIMPKSWSVLVGMPVSYTRLRVE